MYKIEELLDLSHTIAAALFEGKEYALPAKIPVPGFEPWSPEHPKLYGFQVRCGEDEICATFDDAVRAPAPGQSMVLYDGDAVVGGGFIV